MGLAATDYTSSACLTSTDSHILLIVGLMLTQRPVADKLQLKAACIDKIMQKVERSGTYLIISNSNKLKNQLGYLLLKLW